MIIFIRNNKLMRLKMYIKTNVCDTYNELYKFKNWSKLVISIKIDLRILNFRRK